MKTKGISLVCLLVTMTALFNSSSGQKSNTVPMEASYWTVNGENFKFEEHLGAESIYLPSGFASLDDVVFHNGVIEFDDEGIWRVTVYAYIDVRDFLAARGYWLDGF